MAAFLNLLGKSKPAKLTSFYRRAPNAAWVVSICGTSMTYPSHLKEWCLSVVPDLHEWYLSVVTGWPAEHICIGTSMTYPSHLKEWCLSVVPDWPDQQCISGVYLCCQDDLPNTFTWVVSICGARITWPTHLHEWCLSVVPEWPDQHICISGV